MGRIYPGGDQMIFQESETVELKSIVVDDIKKEIIAFANCECEKLSKELSNPIILQKKA